MKKIFVFLFCGLFSVAVLAEDSHEEHGASFPVGPHKGILQASEHDGIKLSEEAIKNFELRTFVLQGKGPWNIPLSAKVLTGEETNVFRLRNNFYRRIDFVVQSENSTEMKITSKDLKDGDELIVHGVGFLRTAEISAFGGVPDEH